MKYHICTIPYILSNLFYLYEYITLHGIWILYMISICNTYIYLLFYKLFKLRENRWFSSLKHGSIYGNIVRNYIIYKYCKNDSNIETE